MSLLISVITINLNNIDGLKRTVESLISQGSKSFEWVFIDGISTDGSCEYVKDLATSGQLKFPNKIISERDSGIYDAMNKGIINSEGSYLLFLNSGDCFRTNQSLEKFEYEYEIEKNLAFYSFAIELEGYGVKVTYPKMLREEFFWNSSLCHQSTFIKKTVFNNLGLYNTNYSIIADRYHFIVGIFKRGYRYKIINDFQMVIFNGDGISSTQFDLRIVERDMMFTEIFGSFTVRNLKELGYYRSLEQNRLIWQLMLTTIKCKNLLLARPKTFLKILKKIILKDNPKERNFIQRGIVCFIQKKLKKKKIEVL